MSRSQYIIGLTGGIASGKSMVAGFFEELGVPVVDTDVIAREVVEPGRPAIDEIRATFSAGVIDESGALDRRKMREIIFSDESKRRALESILHPRIRTETMRQVAAAAGPYVVVVVPLLYESPMKSDMDRIVVVDCEEETQIARLMSRDNETREKACRILATQASRTERLSIADDVVSNDNDPEDAREAVRALHERYVELARNQTN